MIITDNGSQFTSAEFRTYIEYIGTQLRLVTPYWPRANGEIEQFFGNIGKMVKVAILERRDYKAEIVSFLMMYQNTPHTMTNVAPAKLLLTYQPRTKLPQWESNIQSMAMRQAREHDKKMKDHMKSYYKRLKKLTSTLETIIQQQEKKHKFSHKIRSQTV